MFALNNHFELLLYGRMEGRKEKKNVGRKESRKEGKKTRRERMNAGSGKLN